MIIHKCDTETETKPLKLNDLTEGIYTFRPRGGVVYNNTALRCQRLVQVIKK